MAEHGFNRVDESPTRSRGRFLVLVVLGLLAVAGGAGGGLLAGRLWPDVPAQPTPAADDDDDKQEPEWSLGLLLICAVGDTERTHGTPVQSLTF